MKIQVKRLLVIATIAMASATFSLRAQNASAPLHETTLLFDNFEDGSKFYRIPALAVAADGSLVAVADKRFDSSMDLPNSIDVVAKRSFDNGKTWSGATVIAGEGTDVGHGDPAIVLDRNTGDLICIMTAGQGLGKSTREDHAFIRVSRSSDNGATWTEPVDITEQLYGSENSPLKHVITGFASSGAALQLRDGRLMFVLVARPEANVWRLENWAVFSDDGGQTWQVSDCAADLYGDEAKVVELDNGDILMSIRNRDKGPRKMAVSHDRGKTWGELRTQPDLIEPACNGDIISYDYNGHQILLQTLPNDAKQRRNVTIFASLDGGKTWPVKRTLVPEGSAYSSIAELPDGTLGVFTEEDSPMPEGCYVLKYHRVNLPWLFEGHETMLNNLGK